MPDRGLGIIFYRTEQGNEPVREWLRGLGREICHQIGSDIKSVQEEWPASNRKPLVDSFGEGLHEVRTKVNRIQYRVLFCIESSALVLLHEFVKKTQKTSSGDLNLARRRQREVQKGRSA